MFLMDPFKEMNLNFGSGSNNKRCYLKLHEFMGKISQHLHQCYLNTQDLKQCKPEYQHWLKQSLICYTLKIKLSVATLHIL